MLLLSGAALGRMAVPPVPSSFPGLCWSGDRAVALQGHSQLPAEPTARESLLLCCAQAAEIWGGVGLIILQCFLLLKYKWPNGKEIFTNTKIKPEHCLLVEMFTG